MTSPIIVLVEDEKAQLLAMRAALRGLGQLREFGQAQEALEFLKQRAVDAAIIDVHMPRSRMDGMDLINHLRDFDQDLCIIVRTGDGSSELADGAIAARVFRRVIKGKVSVEEFRAVTSAAVRETAVRRKASIDATTTVETKSHLMRALGSAEEELSVNDHYKVFFQSLRNRITAVGGVAEALVEATNRGVTEVAKTTAAKNKSLVSELVTDISSFLDGPYAEALRATRAPSRGTVNGVVEAIRRRFSGSPKWVAEKRQFSATGLMQDLLISASPIKLITALRHLIEFCLNRSPTDSITKLTTYISQSGRAAIEKPTNLILLNPESISEVEPRITFCVTSYLSDTSLDDIRRELTASSSDPREGCLQMIDLSLPYEKPALIVSAVDAMTHFELLLPIGR